MCAVRVFIVDDQEPFRAAAAAVVAATDGFSVVGAADSGESALERIPDAAPDLILMDINLPGIDGIEATSRLPRENGRPVVLLLSTYDESDFGDQATLCGADGYVPKSAFGPERLAAAWAAATG